MFRMADKNPEIITLSSDDDCKPQDTMQPSKKQKVSVNATVLKKSTSQLQSGCDSKTKYIQKQPMVSKNGTKIIELSMYEKYQTFKQERCAKVNKFSSVAQQYKMKNTKNLNSVSGKNFGNTNPVLDEQDQIKSSVVSKTISHSSLRTSTPKCTIVGLPNTRMGSNLIFAQKSNEVMSQNANNKTSIPYSVLSSLRKKGISITNVCEESKSNDNVCNEQIESQKYLSNLRYSLKKSNTNINVVPVISPLTNKAIKSHGSPQVTVYGLKRKLTDCDAVNPNKLLSANRTVASSQNVSYKSVKDLPIKIRSEIKIVEKPLTVKNFSLKKSSKFAYNNSHSQNNSSQKDLQGCTSSVKGLHSKKDPVIDSLFHISSKRSLSITPVECAKNSLIEENVSKNASQHMLNNEQRSDFLPQTCKKINGINSTIKSSLSVNNLSGTTVAKRSHRQETIKNYMKPSRTACKNIDLANDRDALLSFLALCNSNDNEEPPCNINPKTVASNAAVTILPLTFESSVSLPKSKSTISLHESIKLQDVPSKICNWPKLVVTLERLDALAKYTDEKWISHEPVIETFNLSKTSNKLNEQKSEVECYNSTILENSVDICIPSEIENKDLKKTVNFENSQQSGSSSVESLKETELEECLHSSSHLTVTVDPSVTSKEDSNNVLLNPLCAKNSSHSSGLIENTNIEMTLIDEPKNSDSYLSENQNIDELSKINSIKNCRSKSVIDNCDMPNKGSSSSSKYIKNVENMVLCPEAVENSLVSPPVTSEVCNIVKPDMFSHANLICNAYAESLVHLKEISERKLEERNIRMFCPTGKSRADLSNSSELLPVKNFLNDIILKVENERSEEIREEICAKVLNSIVSTVEKDSQLLLMDYQTKVATNIKPYQESVKKALSENSSDLSCKIISKGTTEKEKLQFNSTAVESAVESEHYIESGEKNAENNLLKFNVLSNDEKLLNCLSLSEQVPEKTSTLEQFQEEINIKVCNVVDADTNSGINSEFFIPPEEEASKNVFTETFLNVKGNENKCKDTEIICMTTSSKSAAIDGNGNSSESLSADHYVINDDITKNVNSASRNNDTSIEYIIPGQIRDNTSFGVDGDMGSSKHGLCFQDKNVISSTSPLHENEGLNCIIVSVESKCDTFADEEQSMDFENETELKQNHCVTEQEDMDSNEKVPEPCTFYSEEDTSSKNVYACTDDESEGILNQIHSNQVTSPKLSLKRNRSIESPDHRLQERNAKGYSAENSPKRIKLDESLLLPDVEQDEQISSDKGVIIPFNVNTDEDNKRKFMELLEYSKTLMDAASDVEKEKIVKIMLKKLNETQSWYASSEKFSSLIDSTKNRLKRMEQNSGEDVFSILQLMRKEFKNYKCKLKVAVIKETSQDTNSACSSFSVKISAVEGNNNSSSQLVNHSLIEEITKLSDPKDLVIQVRPNVHSVISLSASDSTASESVKSSASKDSLVENKYMFSQASTSFHSVLAPETVKNSVCQNNTVDKSISCLKSASLTSFSRTESSFKNGIADNDCNSLSIPSTSETVKDAVLNNNIKEKSTKSDSSVPSFQFHSLLINPHELFSDKDSTTEEKFHLHQSTSKSEQSPLVIQNVKPSSSMSSKNLSSERTFTKRTNWDDDVNASTAFCVSVNKINDTVSILKSEKSIKDINPESTDSRSTERIKKLEKTLGLLDKKIKKLQERELSLDDLDNEDSTYIRETQYKARFTKVWEALCKLKKVSTRTGRIIEKKFKYEGSRYRAINIAVEKMIDKRKAHEKFPDYVEVLSLIKKQNDGQKIGLNEREIATEAERVFRDVGKELQIRRWRDHEDLFGCHLTDNFDPAEDPAEHDEELKEVLATNIQNFEQSINRVIDSYAEKQKLIPKEEDNKDNSSDDDEDKYEEGKDIEEYKEDLPSTEPASPECSDTSSCHKRKSSDDITEIINHSDDSTDPNEEVRVKKEVKQEASVDVKQEASTSGIHLNNLNNESTLVDSIDIADSDSSCDLPSIQELMSTR